VKVRCDEGGRRSTSAPSLALPLTGRRRSVVQESAGQPLSHGAPGKTGSRPNGPPPREHRWRRAAMTVPAIARYTRLMALTF
jgi:hypothetical protein